MTDDTANLVQELLRGLRSDMDSLRGEMRSAFLALRERLHGIDLPLEGWRYVFVATTGSLVTDMKDHDARITTLEGAQS